MNTEVQQELNSLVNRGNRQSRTEAKVNGHGGSKSRKPCQIGIVARR